MQRLETQLDGPVLLQPIVHGDVGAPPLGAIADSLPFVYR